MVDTARSTNKTGRAAMEGSVVCEKLAPERDARTYTRPRDWYDGMSKIRRDHGRRSTTEYDSDDCRDADENDGDGKPLAMRQRRSVEIDDEWMTESNVDDSQDDKNISDIGLLHTGAEEQQSKQWRASPSSGHSSMTGGKCNAENRPPSRKNGYTFGGRERTNDDRQTDNIRTEDRNVLDHISPFTSGFGDDYLQVPTGKLASP